VARAHRRPDRRVPDALCAIVPKLCSRPSGHNRSIEADRTYHHNHTDRTYRHNQTYPTYRNQHRLSNSKVLSYSQIYPIPKPSCRLKPIQSCQARPIVPKLCSGPSGHIRSIEAYRTYRACRRNQSYSHSHFSHHPLNSLSPFNVRTNPFRISGLEILNRAIVINLISKSSLEKFGSRRFD
jgi:hypothetical protein